jgi:hypothetical protein
MVRRNHQQLALALAGNHLALVPTPRAATRTRGAQTPTDHSTTSARVTAKVARMRTMPSRDNRGRFVSFPTTDAPSWYVCCADGYRVPGEPPADTNAPAAPTARQPLPRAIARLRRIPRARLTRADLLTYLVFVVGYIAVLWYGLHLPRPNR